MTDPYVTPPDTRPALEQLADLLNGRDLRVNSNYSKNGLIWLYPSGDGDWDPMTEAESRRIVDLFVLRALEIVEADAQATHEHDWATFEAARGGPHHRLIRSCSCGDREDLPPGCPCGANHNQPGNRFL